MDAFWRLKAAVNAAVERLDFLAEYRRLTAGRGAGAGYDNGSSAVADRCTPFGSHPNDVLHVDWRRLLLDMSRSMTQHGSTAAPAVVLAERLAGDYAAAVDAFSDDATGDTWRRLRPGIVDGLDALDRAVTALDAPRREALERLRASRGRPFETAPRTAPGKPSPPPEPASVPPSPASPPAPPSPTPEAVAEALTLNARLVLQALAEAEAVNTGSKLTGAELHRTAGVTPKQLRTVVERDREAVSPCLKSDDGRGGGYWLTAFGRDVARLVRADG
jgi:hypothetical protein